MPVPALHDEGKDLGNLLAEDKDKFADLDARVADLLVRLRKIQSQEEELTRHLRSVRKRGPADMAVASQLKIAVSGLLDEIKTTRTRKKLLIERLETLRLIQQVLTKDGRHDSPQRPEVFLG